MGRREGIWTDLLSGTRKTWAASSLRNTPKVQEYERCTPASCVFLNAVVPNLADNNFNIDKEEK